MSIHISGLKNKGDAYRDGLHAYGTANPFTFATVAAVVAFVLGAVFL